MFDLDETLIIDTADEAYRAAAALIPGADVEAVGALAKLTARAAWRESEFLELGRRLGVASWEAMWADFSGGHPCLDGLRAWVPGHRRAVWQRVLSECGGDPELGPALEAAYIETHRAGHPEVAGAADLVRRLHGSGVALGILTNGPPDIQRLKLAQLGLSGYFTTEVISGVEGVGKPDGAIFERVLAGLGVPPSGAVMVGDSWQSDVEGAVGVGMRAIWVANGRPAPAPLDGVSVVATTPHAGPLLGC